MTIDFRGIAGVNSDNVNMGTPKKQSDGSSDAFLKEIEENVKNKNENQPGNSINGVGSLTPLQAFQKMPKTQIKVAKETGVTPVTVRHLAAKDCDLYKAEILDGYTLKAKIEEGSSVYIEAKFDDGSYQAYEVDAKKVAQNAAQAKEETATDEMDLTSEKSNGIDKEVVTFALQTLLNASKKDSEPIQTETENVAETQLAAETENEAETKLAAETERKAPVYVKSGLEVGQKYDTGGKYVPYSYLADEGGIINYHGVAFVCDPDSNAICLGDMSDNDKVLHISLSGGGSLNVNRDNLTDLSHAFGMFNSKDQLLIMRAIALDAKTRSAKQDLKNHEDKKITEIYDKIINKDENVTSKVKNDKEDNQSF